MSRLPLHALTGFVTAARSGNLSRAADAMHLTVSALSHQIKGLETRLNRTLFVRSSRGVRLTEDGQRLLASIGPHYDAIEEALRPYAARRDDVLTLSLIPSMASAWLMPRLGDFVAQHPRLELNLHSAVGLVDFNQRPDIDAALRSGAGQWPGVTAEYLFDETLVPVASPALLKRLGEPSLEALHQWPLLGDPGGHWERWFAHFGTKRPSRYVANIDDSEALHRAAVEGVGIALARMTRARLLVDGGLLQPVTGASLHTDYAHYLVYPPRSAEHPALLAFRDWLLASATMGAPASQAT